MRVVKIVTFSVTIWIMTFVMLLVGFGLNLISDGTATVLLLLGIPGSILTAVFIANPRKSTVIVAPTPQADGYIHTGPTPPPPGAWSTYMPMGDPGYVYLMELPGTQMTKLGITSDTNRRIREHERHGWSLVEMWQFPSINDARFVETAVHAHADSMGARPRDENAKIAMPQGGYTEVMSLPSAYVRSHVNGLAHTPGRSEAWLVG